MPKANDANNTIRDAADSLQDYLISFTCYLTFRVEHRDIKNICEKDMPYACKITSFGGQCALDCLWENWVF